MQPEHISQVRRFNRLVTQRVGALDEQYLGRDRSLGESRVLHEIGPEGADLRDLRARLGLDSGYLSRLIRSLEAKGLVIVEPLPEDRRVRRAVLTEAGRAEYDAQDRLSDDVAASLLAPLSERQRARLLAAMAEVEAMLRAGGVRIEPIHPAEPGARWCVEQYFAELGTRFEQGFDPAASLPNADDEMVPPRGVFLVATLDGEPVACGGVKATAPGTGYVKRMWVAESARGLGLGRRMLEAIEDHARTLGLARLQLETNRTLTEAIAMYRGAGYQEVPPFNDEPYAHHWFQKDLA